MKDFNGVNHKQKSQPQGRPTLNGMCGTRGGCPSQCMGWKGAALVLGLLALGVLAMTLVQSSPLRAMTDKVGSGPRAVGPTAVTEAAPQSTAAQDAAAGGTAKGDPKPDWQPSYPAALAEAARQGRPVFVRFTAEWCLPCRVMDAQVFPDKKVQSALASRVVPVTIDVD